MPGNGRLTDGYETVRGYLGNKPIYFVTKNTGRSKAYFEIVFGIEDVSRHSYATWRHCMANDDNARYVIESWPDNKYLRVYGFIVSNAIMGDDGKISLDNFGHRITKEWLVVQTIVRLNSAEKTEKQMELVKVE